MKKTLYTLLAASLLTACYEDKGNYDYTFDQMNQITNVAFTPATIQTIDGATDGNPDAYSHHVFYIAGDGQDSGNYGGDAWVRICDGSVNSQETVQYDEIKVMTAPAEDGPCSAAVR